MQTTRNDPTMGRSRAVRECAACGQRFSSDAAFCPFDGIRLAPPSQVAEDDPLLGLIVDQRYEAIEVLGEGGMGRVYRVRHVSLQRAFAMKVLRGELATDEDLAARFMQEAKATAAIRHPNVVQITDFGLLPRRAPYFVMELLTGETLAQALRAGPLPRSRAVPIVERVAAGLAAAHRAGVVHRDLKPDNVFLLGAPHPASRDAGDTGRRPTPMLGSGLLDPDVRVVDFGASKVIGTSRVTRDGIVFGTPHYMAPEQASGQEVDARADIYALGVIMYELLTGRRPFDADTHMGVLNQQVFAEPVPPSRVGIVCDELAPLEPLILRCLAKHPEARFASMAELADALRQSTRASPPSVASCPSSNAPGGPRVAGLSRPVRLKRWIALAVTLLAGGALGWIALNRSLTGGARLAEPAAPAVRAAASLSPSAPPPSTPSAEATASVVPPPPSPALALSSSGRALGSSASPPRRVPALPHGPRPAGGRSLDDIGDPFAAHPKRP